MAVRTPAVAGMFYEGNREALLESLRDCFLGDLGPRRLPEATEAANQHVLGLVCPHAGYMYSGSAAAWAYDALAADGIPDTAVILGPNHHGLGEGIALSTATEWTTPLGTVDVDTEAVGAILQASRYARRDDLAHLREHSLEVQVPFLQFIGSNKTKIVPVTIAYLAFSDALAVAADLGSAIAGALRGRSAVVIASTDFTHYEPAESAEAKDTSAMDRILEFDAEGLLRVVEQKRISMCGAVGAAVMIEACKALGATRARKLTYYTSGDVTGDREQVVGYGAASVEKD